MQPKRLAITAVPLLLALSGLVLLAVAPFAWSAGEDIGYPKSWPTIEALVYGLAGLGLGTVTAWMVFQRMQTRVEISNFHLGSGVMFVVMAVVQVVYALDLPKSSAYGDCPWGKAGKLGIGFRRIGCTPEDLPLLTQWPLEAVVFALVFVVIMSPVAYVYVHAVSDERPSRFDRREDETDAIGEILRRS